MQMDSELVSTYLLMKLKSNLTRAGVEATLAEDDVDSDTWVESPYAMLEPNDIKNACRTSGTWRRPWDAEMKVHIWLWPSHCCCLV